MLNGSGPRQELCSTLQFNENFRDNFPLTTMRCDRPDKYDLSQVRAVPLSPSLDSKRPSNVA